MKANAKINLNLKIINKREDGYHNLESMMVLINLHDKLFIKKNKRMIIKTPFKDDIIFKVIDYFKANNLLKNNYKIVLKKRIPVGAGLGGGSSDAACLIKALNKLEHLNLSEKEMVDIAINFGSDVPFFIYNKNGIISSKGELFSFKKYDGKKYILVIYPNILISTKEVFKNYNGETSNYNDLVPAIFKTNSELKEVINNLKNLFNKDFRITGSGSSIYLISSFKELKKIKKSLNKSKYKIFLSKIIRS